MSAHELKDVMEKILRKALDAVDPEEAIHHWIRRQGRELLVGERSYDLSGFGKIVVAGMGKAAVPMARALEQLLGDRLAGGIVIVKYGHGGALDKCQVLEAGHPEPDEAGHQAALRLMASLKSHLHQDDLLVAIFSGGGSALAPAPVEGISLADKKAATSTLLRCGATIHEINAVRKHISRLKGGRLLDFCGGATVVSLLLSDVVGDDLTSIASGPTVPDPTTFRDCLDILQRYGVARQIPNSVLEYLTRGAEGKTEKVPPETPKAGDPRFEKVQNLIIANNFQALSAAAKEAAAHGFSPLILSSSMQGNTGDVAQIHVAMAREILATGNPIRPPCCLISGGETTVQVKGQGKGGRNQEFALHCALELERGSVDRVLVASLGTDGTDGPTDAAGAWAFSGTARLGREQGLSLQDYLNRNDSYHYFQALGDLIITGPTRTNVMDIRLVLVK